MSMNGLYDGLDQMESHQPSVFGYGYAVNSNSYQSFPFPGTFQSMENDSPVPHGGDLQGEVYGYGYGYGYGVNSDYHQSFPFPGTFQSMENDSRLLLGEVYEYGYGTVNSDYHGSFPYPGTFQSMENYSRVLQREVYGYGYGVNSDYHESFPCPNTSQSMENDSRLLQGEVYGYAYGVNSDDHESFPFPETFQCMENQYSTYRYGVNSDSHENFPFPGPFQSMENDSTLPHGGVLQGDVDYPMPPTTIDPRLLTLLEFSKELSMESQELFKKLFPKLEEEISEGRFVIEEQEDSMVRAFSELLIKKLPTILPELNSNQMRFRTMQRSLSLESPRSPSMAGEDSSLKLQRFKVRTLDLGGKGATKNGS